MHAHLCVLLDRTSYTVHVPLHDPYPKYMPFSNIHALSSPILRDVHAFNAAQYLQPNSTTNSTAPQQAKHPYEEALARLPQSVLDQPPNPPPPNVQPIVDKMAEYAANNGEEFEKTVLEKNKNDPRFSFLRPGNEYHAYYATKKLLCLTKLREASERQREVDKAAVHSLKPDGSVGFALGGSRLQASNVVLEDSSSEEEEGEGLLDGVEVVSEKAERKRKKLLSKGAENGSAAATVDSEFD